MRSCRSSIARCLGGVCGIIGAGGNIGGVAATFLLRGTGNIQFCFLVLASRRCWPRAAPP